MNLLLENASEMTRLFRHLLMEQFGRYLVNDLFALYKDYIRPEWRTFEIILHTESIMHAAVRKLNSPANPPILNVFICVKLIPLPLELLETFKSITEKLIELKLHL
jgi:hypothetical protein